MRSSITRWLKQAKHDPKFKRKRKEGSGRPLKLTPQKAQKLIKIIQKPASKFRFETDLWTTGRMKKICKDELRINVSRMCIHRTLKKYEQS